jgi:hypothetical protein
VLQAGLEDQKVCYGKCCESFMDCLLGSDLTSACCYDNVGTVACANACCIGDCINGVCIPRATIASLRRHLLLVLLVLCTCTREQHVELPTWLALVARGSSPFSQIQRATKTFKQCSGTMSRQSTSKDAISLLALTNPQPVRTTSPMLRQGPTFAY